MCLKHSAGMANSEDPDQTAPEVEPLQIITIFVPNNVTLCSLQLRNVCLKQPARMANSVDPDQTAPQEQSDEGLRCLLILSVPLLRILRYILYIIISSYPCLFYYRSKTSDSETVYHEPALGHLQTAHT